MTDLKKFVTKFKWRPTEQHPLFPTHFHGVLCVMLFAVSALEAELRAKQIVDALPFEIVGEPISVEFDESQKANIEAAGVMFKYLGLYSMSIAFTEETLRLMGFCWWIIGVPISEDGAKEGDVDGWPTPS